MSKTSQAAKVVPEPQGTKEVKAAQTVLSQAREAARAALHDLVRTVVSLGPEPLSEMHDRELGVLLTEAARARDNRAIIMVATAMKGTANLHLEADEAESILGISYDMDVEALLVDGKNTNLADLLISAVRKAPRADAASQAMQRLVKAGVRTGKFLEHAMNSCLRLDDKMQAIELSDGVMELSYEAVEALVEQLIGAMEHGNGLKHIPKLAEVFASQDWSGKSEDELILRLVSHRECAYASEVVKAYPKAFDVGHAEVLKSGCPEALAAFWRAYGPRCDKKVFHEKLTEALRPDPVAMAKAILDNKRYGRGMYPMHPMHPMMMFMGRW